MGGVSVMPSETANVVTTLFGYNENEDLRSSAIPWLFDEWFHGDFKTNRPDNLSDARGTKTLEEYDSSTNPFPAFRINSVIEISFDTSDGQTISNPTAEMTDPNESNSPGGLSPITLEGASDEPDNPFRTTLDYDGSDDFLDATPKGPHTAQKKVDPIGDSDIEGYRASIILGGSDPYLQRMKEDGVTLADLVGADVPAIVVDYLTHVATFYSFLDFVFMADGTKLVRVWDASVYPAHALYVGGTKRDQNAFREGVEWVQQGPVSEHEAFRNFGLEANSLGFTPFDQFGSWGYRSRFSAGVGPHPVMDYELDGNQLSADTVRNQLSKPLFSNSIALV
jgi:hypothetical protein